jgi:hypothetical protein
MTPSADILGAIALVAENRIQAAYDEGAFDNLPGKGQPLALEDDSHLPPELRMAYKILRNSGHLEPDPGIRNTAPAPARPALALLEKTPGAKPYIGPLSRLHVLAARLRSGRLEQALAALPDYSRRVLARLGLPADQH